jgi:hypothetical protein
LPGEVIRTETGPLATPPILYVAGANRSGSTLLEVLLGLHPATVSAGELFNAPRALRDPGAPCTCGKSLADCPLWGEVARALEALARARGMTIKDLAKAVRRVEDRDALPHYLSGRPPGGDAVSLYTAVQRVVIEHVVRTRPGARFLIDPSKSEHGAAARPLALRLHLGLDLVVVHLVRDPRGIVASARRGSNKDLIQGDEPSSRASGPRALGSWLRVNRGASRMLQALGPERALRVRFEDLITRPADAVTAICGFVGLEPAPILATLGGAELPRPEHMIAGNRLRFAPIRLDARHAAVELPWYYGPACAAAAWLAGVRAP